MLAVDERVEHTLIWTGMKAREESSVYSHCLPVTSPAPVPMSLVGLGCVKTLFRNERILAKRQCEPFPALTKP